MALSRFLPNVAGIASLENSSEAEDALLEVAEKGAEIARGLAPVNEGDYRDSIDATVDDGVARINAHDFKAWWIEHGTTDTPAYRVLGRTLDRLRGG